MRTDKTPIAAISTATGRGGIGIVRVSCPASLEDEICQALFAQHTLKPRYAHLLPFLDEQGQKLDDVIALFFKAPNSYTGETVIEIQAHGGPVLMKLVLRAVLKKCESLGIRLARPGEFTERAFLNGRLDLAQAEAVSDLIEAASEAAALAASRSLSGTFSLEIYKLEEVLVELRAYVEASLDFPEEDIENLAKGRIFERVQSLKVKIDSILSQARQGALLRDGVRVALVGSPNVGKSSLLNALAGEEVAIVTDIAGTTRDKIEHWVAFDGVPICMIDTAGLRTTEDIVEQKGIERTYHMIQQSDIVLHLVDATNQIADDPYVLQSVLEHIRPNTPVITVANKVDQQIQLELEEQTLKISAKENLGLDALKAKILELVEFQAGTDGLFIARERHVDCLKQAQNALQSALFMQNSPTIYLDLLAEELKVAHDYLGEIVGITTPDDLLGMIFSKFCIGK